MSDEAKLISICHNYRKESTMARHSRIQQNRMNFDAFHLRQDFSEKQKGQSQEFLPKVAMAVEQAACFMQQGLIDLGDWFRVEPAPGMIDDIMKIKPHEMQRLLTRQLEKTQFMMKVGDAVKLGFLGSLMIAKVHGRMVPKPTYRVETKMKNGSYSKKLVKVTDKAWELKIDLVRQEDFFPDPTGSGLYEMQDIYLDYYEIEAMAKGKDAIYDLEAVQQAKGQGGAEKTERSNDRARETGQNISNSNYRGMMKLTEIWGNFVDEEGQLIYENCVATIMNDNVVIQKPTPNPLWHGESPFVAAPIITVPHGVWGKAVMDAPTMLNRAQNEMFNLILDGGMMSVHGIKQIREHWLEDPSQVEDGISAGDTIRVNTSCPPGATALERVDTATVPTDGINVYNLLNQEFVTAAMTNDLRMGVQPARAVKATEIVESSQAITSMFNGLAKHIEANFIGPILRKSWMTAAQHMDDLDSKEVGAMIGERRASELQKMGPEEIFADSVQSSVFQVFGITETLNKQKDFTKLQAMLQTVSSSPVLMESFAKKYDFTKLLGEIMKSLDIDDSRIESDESMGGAVGQPQQPGGPPGQMPGEVPDVQSQIPQAGSAVNAESDSVQAIAQPDFPASRATPRGGF